MQNKKEMKEIFNCEKCKKSINNDEESISCNGDNCYRKYHKNCTNLNIDQFKLMETTKNTFFICDTCISSHNNINLYQELDRIVTQKFEKYSELNVLRLKEFNNRLNYAEQVMLNKDARVTNYPSSSEKPFKSIYHTKALIVILLAITLGLFMTGFIFGSTIFKNYKTTESTTLRKRIYERSNLRIIAREGWIAQCSAEPLIPLDLPVKRVIVISTHTETCSTQAICTYRVRIIQSFNIESVGQDDIIYNFLIGGDGNVYEGRGWDFIGAHLKGFNNNSISFAYIGTFKTDKPSPKQMNVTKLLLEDGVRNGKLTADYKIDSANKLDPVSIKVLANGLYESFKGWPQWSN